MLQSLSTNWPNNIKDELLRRGRTFAVFAVNGGLLDNGIIPRFYDLIFVISGSCTDISSDCMLFERYTSSYFIQ